MTASSHAWRTQGWRAQGWRAMLLVGAAWAAIQPHGLAAAEADSGIVSSQFRPPLDQPMLLSRTLTRSLADGKQIVATRRYRVRFTRAGDGWRVDGELADSEIEAPEALRALAEVERNRPDDGLFPVLLDRNGLIVAGSGPAMGEKSRAAVEQAVTLALARLGDRPQPPAVDGAAIAAFLGQVQALAAAAVTTQWPARLFLPATGGEREEQRFALRDGREGVLTSELAMTPSADRSTMASCERRIVTELAGNRRISREQFRLEPQTHLAAR